jgi:putative Mg2+ transporter-C (MgtC) family protein
MGLSTLVNISLAMLLGGAIGFERQWNQGMAGLRTNTLVAFGSACFVTIGIHMGDDRVAAQLVSGIGFLGAGVILHEGPTIRGLNTAATLWCAAAAGALAGVGLRIEAIYAAVGVVLLNLGLRRIQTAINQRAPHPIDVETAYTIEIVCRVGDEESVYQQLSRGGTGLELRAVRREPAASDAGGEDSVKLVAELSSHTRLDAEVGRLVSALGLLPGVRSAGWMLAGSGGSPGASLMAAIPRR